MKQFITKASLSLLVAAAIVLPSLALPVGVGAQAISEENRTAACQAIGSTGGDCATGSGGITGLISSVINILSLVVGVAAVIMVIVGGFRYVTSGGDANAISAAKNTILYAIIGLVIAALAQGIVRFVLNRVTTPPPASPETSYNISLTQHV
jgi:hypothetical protein